MSLEKTRLASLIEFVQQSAKLRMNPVADVTKHGIFHEFEHSLSEIPGIHLNTGNDGDEIWLVIDRLHESFPPTPKNKLLQIWLDLSNTPSKEPTLKDSIEFNNLLEADLIDKDLQNAIEQTETIINFKDFSNRNEVEAQFKTYLKFEWNPWAVEEKKRRRSVNLYSKLFTLKQQLEGSITDLEIELVWGTGLSIWNTKGININYPFITQLVEVNLNPKNMSLEIRPRNTDFRFELDIYTAADIAGVSELEKAYKTFISESTLTFSPFDSSSFEPLLQSAVAHLDSSGIYWPKQTVVEDRHLPKISEELKVTDTWVLFVRPRSKSSLIQDLERFKNHLENEEDTILIPKAIRSLVTEPLDEHEIIHLPSYRGISLIQSNEHTQDIADLFFPLPFNDEQVRIVQMLECHAGVVVQGPPGTGKTHTIANIISHYLALGKRILVTSMKDPALKVLRDKLPEDVRPLAVNLLLSEREGMQQFEHSISRIASEVQSIDRHVLMNQIQELEEDINSLHAKLASISYEIREVAKNAIEPIYLGKEKIYPETAAKELIEHAESYEWLEDNISVDEIYTPKFDDSNIIRIREIRRLLGLDLNYLDTQLPELTSLPNSNEILIMHHDLSNYTNIQELMNDGKVPSLADSNDHTKGHILEFFSNVSKLIELKEYINNSGKAWSNQIIQQLKQENSEKIIELFELLGNDLKAAITEQNRFLERPVIIPSNIEIDEIIIQAIQNKARGKSAFGLFGLIKSSNKKNKLRGIRIITDSPKNAEDWQYIYDYVLNQKNLRELMIRWNSISQRVAIETFSELTPDFAIRAYENYTIFYKITRTIELEELIIKRAVSIFPSFVYPTIMDDFNEYLQQLHKALEYHITYQRLSAAWFTKEKLQNLLANYNGKITEEIKDFINKQLGNSKIKDIELQQQWSRLINELNRIHGLKVYFEELKNICNLISESGAIKWAERLKKEPLMTTVDSLLPDNWQQAWRLRRLANYFKLADNQHKLKALTKKRSNVEANLSKAYQNAIAKRTWLRLAEKATPSIRAALEAYKIAVAKIGKGTGKRVTRYRQDARNAANLANSAIPCWIMRHDKISESLPAKLASFDLVIIDEASQSDLTALPALLRAEKILIVGDDKQVSPDGIGLDTEKVDNLIKRYLSSQIPLYRPQMTPERSIYDLFKVVFSSSSIMLKEHFRCNSAIIEYSKREFYPELKPIRIPKASERLDPPLIDVFIEDGFRKNDINPSEAQFIVNEIKKICIDSAMENRTIGVISLLGNKQAFEIWRMLEKDIGYEMLSHYKISCGDARTFQGEERDIIFLSLVVSPEDSTALGRESFAQRFNVAASRARDRMYLVRSVDLDDLSPADKIRRSLINHFALPFIQDKTKVKNLRELCESDFEKEIYDVLTERGYRVIPQVKVGEFRIDIVVEGEQDARIAIECDGDRYHGIEQWEYDITRQRILERAGWCFWRCFASTFVKHRTQVIDDLINTLREQGIEPIGSNTEYQNISSEHRRLRGLQSHSIATHEINT